ncbi:DUF4230 domain-containing protein [Sphingobacterium hotanense]|uniref:DUF4230 domain-containing protein n=1 Tax=Sphingobacterium hotanense TaxID=649196 RepID=UPI0021A2966C|nr:DUF4230 domain-containing protein [Sphingobacterium hotanense]MCT1526192.1 DUF4230 domain-containing protein [Sphingobacterium hotanense]
MMTKLLKVIILLLVVVGLGWFIWQISKPKTNTVSNHQVLLERIESMGKLELVKYRLSDVVEHKVISQFLPDASVLLIIKADAVGCVDLSKLKSEDVEVLEDSVHITLPNPEICYVKIDHKESKVYDTKMAFFREANMVDEAFKAAENEITKQVKKSDILEQTKKNAVDIFKPLMEGLGYNKYSIGFE